MNTLQSFIASIALFLSSLFSLQAPTALPTRAATPTVIIEASASATPLITSTPIANATLVASIAPTKKPLSTVTLASTPVPTTPQYAGSGSLLGAMNSYRKGKGLSSLSSNSDLCRIAQTRANEQQQLGHLDHSNFQAQAATQTRFLHVAEILQYWSEPRSADDLVNIGWAASAEHAAVMNNPAWTHGCGGTAGLYSTFIFGN